MSLLWRDQVRFVLCPDQVIAVRVRRGFRPRILAKEVIPVPKGEGQWQTTLSSLSQALKQDTWQKADAVVILSNRFASYQLLSWSANALSVAEQQARAQHVFRQTYGESSASLELRISEGNVGTASLVAGIESEIIRSLREVFRTSTLKLVSIQPYLMCAFNAFRHRLKHRAQWFVVQETGMTCAGLLHQGAWQSIRIKKTSENWLEETELVLRREQISNGIAEQVRTVYCCTLDAKSDGSSLGADWSFHRLQLPAMSGFSPMADSAYGMAVAGVR